MNGLTRWIVGLAAFGAAFQSAPAPAQDAYPSRPVRLIVGFAPGSAADITARVLANKLTQTLGQQVVVEGRPGAGSSLAADFVAKSPKDGYTLYLSSVANTINATLNPNQPFDLAKDFAPIAAVTTLPNILVVHPTTGVKSVPDLITLIKAQPDKFSYASSGFGTSPHLSGELFNVMAGVKVVHIPYPGSAQAVSDLLAGRVQFMFSPASTVLAHVADGKLIALASTQLKRASAAPNLPTMSEAGLKDFETGIWFGVMAPAGTPPSVIERLNRALNEAVKSPDVSGPLAKQGIDMLGGSADEFARYVASETQKWARVIEAAGMKK